VEGGKTASSSATIQNRLMRPELFRGIETVRRERFSSRTSFRLMRPELFRGIETQERQSAPLFGAGCLMRPELFRGIETYTSPTRATTRQGLFDET